jgi:hypothetical protein
MMFLGLGLVLFLALAFMCIVQQLSSRRPLSSIWKQTLLYRTLCIPRKPVSDTEIILSQDVKPYQFPPLKERTSTKMAMGLKRLDESNWLTLDSKYLPEHFLRCSLLCTKNPQVIQCLPGSEAACHEVLSIVTSFLFARFPQHFTITTISSGPAIHNHLTNEIFPIGNQNCLNPLEIAAKLSMEDFNVLMKNPETGDYHLQASATLFPAGWKLQERVGTSMANLHAPVPGWKQKLGGNVNRYHCSQTPAGIICSYLTDILITFPQKRVWKGQTCLSRLLQICSKTLLKLCPRGPFHQKDLWLEGNDKRLRDWQALGRYYLPSGRI